MSRFDGLVKRGELDSNSQRVQIISIHTIYTQENVEKHLEREGKDVEAMLRDLQTIYGSVIAG